MVRIHTAQIVDVHCDLRVIDKTVKKLTDQIHVKRANACAGKWRIEHQPRPTRKINHHARERLIERHIGVAVTHHAALVANRLREGLPERDTNVLNRVVVIDVRVAIGRHAQIHQTMTRDLVEHMVEKRHAGVQLGFARAIEV